LIIRKKEVGKMKKKKKKKKKKEKDSSMLVLFGFCIHVFFFSFENILCSV
jgi:hypothetical protein